jgi:hypothetical protein
MSQTAATSVGGAVADPSTFKASMNVEVLHSPHSISVGGIVDAGYRVEHLTVEKSSRAPEGTLLLVIDPKLAPSRNPHSNAIRQLPVTFLEQPLKQNYERVEVECAKQRFSVNIVRIV